MASYSNFTLTNRGMELFSDLLRGQGEMEFRHLAAGAGIYGETERGTEHIRGMEALKEERQRIPFSAVKKGEGGTVGLKADLSNQGLAEGYHITEIGIYAGKKGEAEEILYCVATTDNPDYMPDSSSGRNYNVIFRTLISLGDAEEITVNYTSDSYVSAEDFREALDSLKEEVTQALKGKADAEEDKGLSSNDYTDEDKTAVSGLNGLSFGKDADGNWGYKAPGAENVEPFGASGGGAVAVTVKCGPEAIEAGSIIAGKDGEYSTLKPGMVFDTVYPILYAAEGIQAGGTGTACPGALFPVQGQEFEPYRPVYIIGQFRSGMLFAAGSTSCLVQEITPGNTISEYIKLGTAAEGGKLLLEREHPVYDSKLGAPKPYSPMYGTVRNFIDAIFMQMLGLPVDRYGRTPFGTLRIVTYSAAYAGDYRVKKAEYDKIIVVCTRAVRRYTSETAQFEGFGNLENVLIADTDSITEEETDYYVSSGEAADRYSFRLDGEDVLVSNRSGKIPYSIFAQRRYGT